MDQSSSPPGLNDPSPVLEISGKIVIAGVIVIFIVVAFMLVLHVYARCLWPGGNATESSSIRNWRRQLAGAHQQQQGADGRRRRHRGLDKSTLDSLPVVAYDPEEFKDGLECAVCLSELEQGEKTRVLPRCNHLFHADCVDVWFQAHSTCPICRDHVVVVTVFDDDSDTTGSSSDESSAGGIAEDDSRRPHDDDLNSVDSRRRFPTNVLFWGDETQVRSLELPSEEGTSATTTDSTTNAYSNSSTSSSNRIGGDNPNPNGMLVIDIPSLPPGESCSPLSTPRDVVTEEASSPMATGLRSLRRLLSRGKRVAPSPSSSTSNSGAADAPQHV